MPFAHDVYFLLNDDSPAHCDKLVRECNEFLDGHDGGLVFSAGIRAQDSKRDVNDQGFSVSLHILFRDKAAHDAYQVSARHKEFIARNSSTWKSIRVFDSVTPPR